MSDLELVMTGQDQAFAPGASSQHVLAQYKNPFGFSLQLVEGAEDITLVAGGTDVAEVREAGRHSSIRAKCDTIAQTPAIRPGWRRLDRECRPAADHLPEPDTPVEERWRVQPILRSGH